MIRDDRNGLKTWGIFWIVFALIAAIIPLGAVLADFQHPSLLARDFQQNGPIQMLLLYVAFSLLRGSTYLLYVPSWRLVNYRRQMAAAWGFAARVPLAQQHPLPNVGALPLPFTIKLKPNWPLYLAPLGGITGFVPTHSDRFQFSRGHCSGMDFWGTPWHVCMDIFITEDRDYTGGSHRPAYLL